MYVWFSWYLSNYTVSMDLHSEKHKTQKWLQEVYLKKKIPNCIKLLWDFFECKSFNIWKYFCDSKIWNFLFKISRHFIHQCSELKEIIFTVKVIFQTTHTFEVQELCGLFLWYLAQCLGLWIVCQTKLNMTLLIDLLYEIELNTTLINASHVVCAHSSCINIISTVMLLTC